MTNETNLLNQLPGLHAIIGANGKFITINEEFAKYIGFNCLNKFFDHERTYYDVRTNAVELADIFYQEDNFIIETKQPLKLVAFCHYQEGMRWLFGTKKPVFDDDGCISAIGMSFLDITDTELRRYCDALILKDTHLQLTYQLKTSYNNQLFSKRESECLFHILRGKSAGLIAKIFGLSVRTIETHIDNIKIKLGCKNKAQVIEKALDLGYYYILPISILNFEVAS